MGKYFVTTPIYYVNDKPHLGHAYTTLCADVLARWHRQDGDEVFFLTGTDEHGAKVEESAAKAGLKPLEFATQNAARFKQAWSSLDIAYDYFIRTSDSKHEQVVQELLQRIYDRGYIYQAEYQGLYCVGCEKFLQADDLVNGKCPFHPNTEPVQQKEINYFFKLSAFVDDNKLLKALEDGQYNIVPEARKNEVIGKIKKGLQDVSISRAGVSWGVPVPWDNSQTIYVWVDALINYYSATVFTEQGKGFWPANLHLMAKDILWFHAVIWPALLMAAGLPLPQVVAAHGFFTIDGQKMSKSLGNVIDPNDLVKEFGAEAARYLIMAEVPFVSDGDVSLTRFRQRYQADLANGLGNIFTRLTDMVEKFGIIWPDKKSDGSEHRDFFDMCFSASGLLKNMSNKEVGYPSLNLDFSSPIHRSVSFIAKINQDIQNNKPWEMYKQGQTEETKKILGELANQLLSVTYLLEPYMPVTSGKIRNILLADKIIKSEPLFPRLDNE